MTTTAAVHAPGASAPIHLLLAERWSTRAFDPRHALSDDQAKSLLQAARWAPSASNTQPWRFLVTHRGTADHATVLSTLAVGNQVWAAAASALIVVAAVGSSGSEGEAPELPWAAYDTGQAVAHLNIQAQHDGLSVHQIGGFDADTLGRMLNSARGHVRPLVVLAVGRHEPDVHHPEPLPPREHAPRERRPLDDLILRLDAPSTELAA